MSYILNLATGVVTRVSDGTQVAPAQSAEDPLYLDYTNWITSGNQPTLVNIPPPASIDMGRKITKLAFRNRFTSAEKVSLEMMSLDDPSAPLATRQVSAALRVYLKDLDNAKFIDLGRTDTEAAVLRLSALGIITMERAGAILNDPIQSEEKWES